MTKLDDILKEPISWQTAATDPDLRMFLNDLQANIMKGHGRHHTGNMFLSFAGMKPHDVAAIVRTLGQHCTSAYQQLRTNKRYPPHLDGGAVRCLFLSASGYTALAASQPQDSAFLQGMSNRPNLQDPPRSEWNPAGWHDGLPLPDAMFLIAHSDPKHVTAELESAEGWLNGTGVRILVIERGLQQTRTFKGGGEQGVEHFGYVDGRSQPLFLKEDIDHEPMRKWKAQFSPSQFIVADPNGRTALSAGSYFVFRKLEQKVRDFNAAETTLAKALFGPNPDQKQLDRAGAMVVGRFENGTPLVLSPEEKEEAPVNDFNFDEDQESAVCPFHAHIRKTNPRGDVKRALGKPDDVEDHPDRDPIMARRGITYGAERPKTADKSEFADDGQEPNADVGLLFMAYMASIVKQFEFTQQSWVNNVRFVGQLDAAKGRPPTGIDPVIGQDKTNDPATHVHTYLDGWTAGAKPVEFSFAGFVKMQGGEYFFAPSLSFLRSVGL
jgi:Dyp-type peroxidase family